MWPFKRSGEKPTEFKTTTDLVAAMRDYSRGDWDTLLDIAADEMECLLEIVDAAWNVRREEKDYTPSPDLMLRAEYRKKLHALLDACAAIYSVRAAGLLRATYGAPPAVHGQQMAVARTPPNAKRKPRKSMKPASLKWLN